MTKKDLVRIIREVVKREVKVQVNNILTEMEAKSESKMSINEALEQTKEWPTMSGKTFTAADARAQFASMQNGNIQTDLNGKHVNVNELGGGLDKALTRDYSELVKRMNK